MNDLHLFWFFIGLSAGFIVGVTLSVASSLSYWCTELLIHLLMLHLICIGVLGRPFHYLLTRKRFYVYRTIYNAGWFGYLYCSTTHWTLNSSESRCPGCGESKRLLERPS